MVNAIIPHHPWSSSVPVQKGQTVQAAAKSYTVMYFSINPTYCSEVAAPKMKILEFTNSVDLGEAAHYEPPHLDRHCLPSIL